MARTKTTTSNRQDSSPATSEGAREYRDPTAEELESPLFNAIWNAIKGWDISRERNGLYSGATGTDVCIILDAISGLSQSTATMTREEADDWAYNFLKPFIGPTGGWLVSAKTLHDSLRKGLQHLQVMRQPNVEPLVNKDGLIDGADLFWPDDDREQSVEPEEYLSDVGDGLIVEFAAAKTLPNFFGYQVSKNDGTDDSEAFFFNTKSEAEAALASFEKQNSGGKL